MADKNTALTTAGDNGAVGSYLALQSDIADIREMMTSVLGPEGFSVRDLERIKMPAGGGLAWMINTAKGLEPVGKIKCVIIAQRQGRVYWKESIEESGGSSPPDCFSDDAIQGIGDPGVHCATCQFAQWGSGRGKGQACSLKRVVFFLREDQILPSYIMLPPTSERIGKQYIMRLMAQNLMPWDVVTEIGLEQDKGPAGPYSKAKFEAVAYLSDDEKQKMRAVVQAIKPAISAVRVVDVDINGDTDYDDSTGHGSPSAEYAGVGASEEL